MSTPRDSSRDATYVVTHADARDALPALALGALDAVERERVLAHVATCSDCIAELAGLRDSTAALALAAPRAADAGEDAARRSAVRERLMARAAADANARRGAASRGTVDAAAVAPSRASDSSGTSARSTPVTPLRAPRWPLFAALAASLLVAAVLGLRAQRALGERDALLARLAASTGDARRTADELRARLAERDQTLAALTGRDVRVVELTASAPSAPWARMFWDRRANRWLMFAGNLPRSAAGRTYELWLIADGRKIPAGTFEPDARGQAVVRAEYALDARALQAVAVTAEPAGGVDVPTGPVVIAGTAGAAGATR